MAAIPISLKETIFPRVIKKVIDANDIDAFVYQINTISFWALLIEKECALEYDGDRHALRDTVAELSKAMSFEAEIKLVAYQKCVKDLEKIAEKAEEDLVQKTIQFGHVAIKKKGSKMPGTMNERFDGDPDPGTDWEEEGGKFLKENEKIFKKHDPDCDPVAEACYIIEGLMAYIKENV